MSTVKNELPSLMSAVLKAAAQRVALNKPLKTVSDTQLINVMSELSAQLYLTRHVPFKQTDTIEKLLSEALREGCRSGVAWAYEDNHKYSEVINTKQLLPLVVADYLPEFVARYYSIKLLPVETA